SLIHEEFTIVGVVRSPYYICVERGSASIGSGTVVAYVYLPEDAFDMEVYTTAYLLVEGAMEMTAFYEEYDDTIEDVIDALEPFGEVRAKLRYEEIITEAEEKIADAEVELADAKEEADKELRDAERELRDAERELRNARRDLDDGWKEYEDGKQELMDAYSELMDAQMQLRDAEKELTDGEEEYEDGLAEYRNGLMEYEDGRKQLDDGYYKLADGQRQLDQSREQFGLSANFTLGEAQTAVDGAKAQLAEGIAQCDAGINAILAQFPGGESDINAAIAQCEQGIVQYEQGIAQYKAALQALDPSDPMYDLKKAGIEAEIATLEAGAAQVTAQKAQLQEAKAGLATATATKADLLAKQAQLAAVTGEQLYAAKVELDAGWAEYYVNEEKLADAKKQLVDAEKELADGRKELDDGWQEYYDGKQELADGWVEYNDGVEKMPEAYEKLTDGEREYRDGYQEYRDGYQEYLDGKAEAEEKIADAEEELADARRKVADIENGEWFILPRAYNPGYTGFGQDADRMANLAGVFPIIFFLVAALVCLTTMTRMVEDHRTQIGLMKALGYQRWTISKKYLGYGLLPSLVGSVLGLAIGHLLFPTMIYVAYQIMYEMPDLQLRFYPDISISSTLAAVGCTVGATLFACLTTLVATPANLMRPRAPKAGKRVLLEYITPLWRSMSFNWKITTRNLLRYQKRFWMTIVGIGGCTALIIAGFGLRDSLLMTMQRQFGELFLHDVQLTLASGLLESERSELEDYLRKNGVVESYTEMHAANVTAESEDYSIVSFLQVMQPEEIEKFIVLRGCDEPTPITVGDDGVVIGQKLGELLNVGVGDSFVISGDGRQEVTVAAICENYVAHYIYMSPAYYEKVYGEAAEMNAMLLNLSDKSDEACTTLMTELLALNGVASAARTADTRNTYLNSMERVDFVVVIVILCAAALAIVVLYNLSNINITERQRELATIKVLGFFDNEVSSYVTRENVVLTILGILFGCVLGKLMHSYLVLSVEIDLMMFGRELLPKSYVWSALLTVLFATVVNFMAHRKMRTIDMVESLKSAE
ncbi:MAG: FtsX-like permease family protein, partial [Oscillospiraceae bacterium]|nr:FtsX-like permease family protein [Oscillospiraceae bacterium]